MLPRHPDVPGRGGDETCRSPSFGQHHAGMDGLAAHTVLALGGQSCAGLCGSASDRGEPLSSQASGKTHTQLARRVEVWGRETGRAPKAARDVPGKTSFRKQSRT